jgi:hypothetical protein
VICKLVILFIVFLFFIIGFRTFRPQLADVLIVTETVDLKTKSFIHRIAFFFIFDRGFSEIPSGSNNGLSEFVPGLQEELGGGFFRARASEMFHELSLPFGFSFRLEAPKNAIVERPISTHGADAMKRQSRTGLKIATFVNFPQIAF